MYKLFSKKMFQKTLKLESQNIHTKVLISTSSEYKIISNETIVHKFSSLEFSLDLFEKRLIVIIMVILLIFNILNTALYLQLSSTRAYLVAAII